MRQWITSHESYNIQKSQSQRSSDYNCYYYYYFSLTNRKIHTTEKSAKRKTQKTHDEC